MLNIRDTIKLNGNQRFKKEKKIAFKNLKQTLWNIEDHEPVIRF